MNNVLEKIKKLPKEVRDYLTSMKASDLNLFICKKYKIEDVRAYTDIVGSLFFKELKLLEFEKEIIQIFGFDDKTSKQITLDTAGIRLLVIDDYLEGDVSKYIKAAGKKISDYDKYIKEQDEALLEEEKYFEEQAREDAPFVMVVKNKKQEKIFDPEIEKQDSIKIFNSNIVNILLSKTGPHIDEYNAILLKLLMEKKSGFKFKNSLEKALLSNAEKIINGSLIYNKKKIKSTVANWIKYFIRIKGSDIFDNIVLTDFMMKSVGVKKFSKEDKEAITKLLILYRNVKFFPRSMPNKTGEGWGIIPSGKRDDKQKDKMELPKQVSKEEKNKYVKKIEDEKKYEQKLAELELLLGKYPDNSLERKMVEEEIVKFKK